MTKTTDNHDARWLRVQLGSAPAALLVALMALAGSGCRQGQFRASGLPRDLMAAQVPNLQQIDLAKLGGQSFDAHRIYTGDLLNVRMATGVELEEPQAWPLRVRDDGTVEVPLVGPVQVASMDLRQAEQAIRFASMERQVYRQPAVGVVVSQRQVNRVTVSGAVPREGTYEIPSAGSNLMTALLMAGGLDKYAARYVEVRIPTAAAGPPNAADQPYSIANASYPGGPALNGANGGPQPPGAGRSQDRVLRVDLLTVAERGGGDIALPDGAVVTVQKQEPRYVQVIGLVKSQQRVEIPPGENIRLTDAIAVAAGTSMSPVVADKVHIVRKRPGSNDTVVIQASIRKAKDNASENIFLSPDDVVSVEETPITFALGTLQGLLGIGVTGLNQVR